MAENRLLPVSQDDFTGGELAPLSRGRRASPAYQHGLRTALNLLATLDGFLLNRSGTRLTVTVGDQANAPWLFDFQFSDSQTFVLEIGNFYFRVLQNGALVPGVVITGAVPWAIADLPYLKGTQNGDVITFTCRNPVSGAQYAPYEVTRVSNTNWRVAAVSYVPQAYFGGLVNQPGTVASPFQPLQISNLYLIPKNSVLPELYNAAHTYDSGHIALLLRSDGYLAQYISTVDTNIGNPPETSSTKWQLHSMQSTGAPAGNGTAGGTQPIWSKNDFVYYYGKLYVSLADSNQGNDSNGGGPDFVVNRAAWWAQAIDASHPAQTTSLVVTQLWQNSLGQRLETLASPVFTPPTTGGQFSFFTDRLGTLLWAAPDLTQAPASFVLLGHNIYAGKAGGVASGTFGLIGSTDATTFSYQYNGAAPDFGTQPPRGTNPFDYATGQGTKAQAYPASVTDHEQRVVYAGTSKKPQNLIGSKIGNRYNFDVNTPQQDKDSYDLGVASNRLEDVRWLLALRHLLVGTGESVFNAYNPSGAITPTGIIIRRATNNGCGFLHPLTIDLTGIYYTNRGRVHDLNWDWRTDNYVSRNLTTLARHLFDGHSIVDWAYAQHPWSIVYAVRDDGVLLALTYSPGGIEAWTRLTTSGVFERVCTVVELDPVTGAYEDAVYVVVRRIINGTTTRFIERFSSRLMPQQKVTNADGTTTSTDDVRLCNFLDCSLQYDGRGTAATIQLTGASFNAGDAVTLTAGANFINDPITGVRGLTANDVGADIVLDPDGLAGGPLACHIVAVTDAVHATVVLEQALPVGWQAQALGGPLKTLINVAFAAQTLQGFGHLIGQTVNALADGAVVSGLVVQPDGSVNLGSPAVLAQVGLPFTSDLELLDLAQEQVRTNYTSVQKVVFEVVSSRGILAGEDFTLPPPSTGRTAPMLDAPQLTDFPDAQPGTPPLFTGYAEVMISSSWNQRGGRACLRQSDPLPLSITGVTRWVTLAGK